MPITPRMVERLGPGPALIVLGWLVKVLTSPSGYDRHFVRRTGEGRRCVAATQEQVAADFGGVLVTTNPMNRAEIRLSQSGRS